MVLRSHRLSSILHSGFSLHCLLHMHWAPFLVCLKLLPSACTRQQGSMYTRNHQQTRIYMHARHIRRAHAIWINTYACTCMQSSKLSQLKSHNSWAGYPLSRSIVKMHEVWSMLLMNKNTSTGTKINGNQIKAYATMLLSCRRSTRQLQSRLELLNWTELWLYWSKKGSNTQ